MPAEAAPAKSPPAGRCYCGACTLSFEAPPLTVVYCHCRDCRRWTGAPVAAFAAFDSNALSAEPPLGAPFIAPGAAERWHCPTCGSPLAARFDYLPGQIYVPLGILDDAAALPPSRHCHDGARLPWLHIEDALERTTGSARSTLAQARHEDPTT